MLLLALICGTLWIIWRVYAVFAYRPRHIAGSTVLVTGACGEVGRRLCIQLYARGARVIAWDYSRIKLQELQAEVQRTANIAADDASPTSNKSIDDSFVISAVDASSRVQVLRASKEIDGPVDIIINAAHSFPTKPLRDRADDSIDRVVQTNLVSALLVVRQLLPALLTRAATTTPKQHAAASTAFSLRRRDDYAQIVNIVAAAGSYTVAAAAPDYAASQWGMVGLHYSMRAWIAQERAAYASGSACTANDGRIRGTSGKASSSTSSSGGGGGGGQPPREIRTTLLCIDDIQNGVPTALTTLLAPASAMLSTSHAVTSPTSADREEDGGQGNRSSGSNARSTRAMASSREGYTVSLQKRNAELDRAVAACMNAICRGEERYCYTSSWCTSFVYPLVLACPVPWAERLLRWLQRAPTTSISTE